MSYEKMFSMKFSKVYQMLIDKAVRKGRTLDEVYEVTTWLMGYSVAEIEKFYDSEATYQDFFVNAPKMHENRHLIKGSICGVKLEAITDELVRNVRYLDKLVDELAKGKAMEKILRKE